MRLYWVQDHIKQGHFNIFWKPGVTNLGDYFTKYHPPHHHQKIRPVYLHCADHTEHDSARLCYSGLDRGSKSRQNNGGKTQGRLLYQSHTGLETGSGKQMLSLRSVPTKPCIILIMSRLA